MRHLTFLLCFLFIISLQAGGAASRAQNTDEWRVAFYDQGMRAVVLVTPDGVETVPLPEALLAAYPDDVEHYTSHLSPDGRYFLLTFFVRDVNPDPVLIVDVTAPNHFTPFAELPLQPEEYLPSYGYVGYGVFSPDGTEVALSYTSHDRNSQYACCAYGGMVTVELATGQITRQFRSDRFMHLGRMYAGNTVWLGNWTQDGIEFFPKCSPCTPPYEFTYYLWNPDTDTIISTRKYESIRRSERLASTGELLYSHSHPDYPPGDSLTLWDPNSVVEVYQPDQIPFEDDGQAVFYDTDFITFDRAHWIMGGQAFIFNKELSYALVSRDGQRFDFELASEQTFLGMTPSGWLMADDVDGRILHYQYHDGDLLIDEIADLQGPFQRMGESNTTSYGLQDFVMSIPAPDVFFCPGSLPTNLAIGDEAEVIGVDMDYLGLLQPLSHERSANSQGEHEPLPIGTVVHVVYGPLCDNPGLTYWTVDYDGVTGLMAEVFQTRYLLRPLD